VSSLRTAQKQLTRRLLLESGLAAFEAKGYAAATVDDIASGAGTTRTTFYLHFPSKVELIKALIVDIYEQRVGSEVTPLVEVVASGERERIRGWLQSRFDQWPESMRRITAAHQAAASEPEVGDVIEGWFEGIVGEIHQALDMADRFDAESRHVRGVLAFGQLEFLSRRWQFEGWDVDQAVALEMLTDSWCHLLCG
jgi:AcrR family transcriptional regulator